MNKKHNDILQILIKTPCEYCAISTCSKCQTEADSKNVKITTICEANYKAWLSDKIQTEAPAAFVTKLPDETIQLSRKSNIITSNVATLDALEEDCFKLFKKYLKTFNIKIDKDAEMTTTETDIRITSGIQDTILNMIEATGFVFDFK